MTKGRKAPPPVAAPRPTILAGMYHLEEIWRSAGSPPDKHPISFIQSPQGRALIRDGLDRGLLPQDLLVTDNVAIQDVFDAIVAEWHAQRQPPSA